MANILNLFCLTSGELASNAFPVAISSDETVDVLKDLIKAEKTPKFDDIAANKLTLWRVTIPIDEDEDDEIITATSITTKRLLKGTGKISKVFGIEILEDSTRLATKRLLKEIGTSSRSFKGGIPEDTVHIIIERPKGQDLEAEAAALRKQLSEALDPKISLEIIVKPESKVAFTWSTMVDTATLDCLKKRLFHKYPQYAHDNYLEIYVYTGQPKPELICDNEDLRTILKAAKTASKTKLMISLETPTKNFSAWTFKDVCAEYDLSDSSNPGLGVISPFIEIQAATLDDDFQKKICDQLITKVESRMAGRGKNGPREACMALVTDAG
ncbi:hypothetical protein BG011_010189 [Mortierella polycephala]|uniref:Crinkler effector protein N-terminal domain-containing protein n=1 Tax=Mortierella polycephala TaxID=41804 RepID=A0A9P6U7G1_9FUNG|nr:hypothetical protein BG011_010189 [Mortierella polycephala]